MFRKLTLMMCLVACFGLTTLSGCGGGDDAKKDDAKGAAEDMKDKADDAAKDAMDKKDG